MGIQRYWGRCRQQWCSIEPLNININSDSRTNRGDRRRRSNRSSGNFFLRCLRLLGTKQLHNTRTWSSLSIYSDIFWARDDKSNSNTARNHNTKRHRYNKYLYSIATLSSLLTPNIALAQGVGGVSATANPIANSSGSVTNQAIQVLQGPYITNTYGGGVQCQGSTFNVTPYIQFADSRKHPWEDFYMEPQYNLTDVTGRTVKQTVTVKNYPWEDWYDDRTKDDGSRWFEDGDDIQIEVDVPAGDGVPDAVSNGSLEPTWMKPIRTDMRASQSFNAGVSATLSIPLNRKLVRQCHEAAQAQIAHQVQLTSNKRLDFEIARLKNCGELKKAGIFFHPASPYHSVCADVVVTSPGGKIIPHEHTFPKPKFSDPSGVSSSSQNLSESSPSSPDNGSSSVQTNSDGAETSQALSELSSRLSSQQVSQPSTKGQPAALLGGPMSLQLPQLTQ